jgi:predicted O-methyltransferase YrrM
MDSMQSTQVAGNPPARRSLSDVTLSLRKSLGLTRMQIASRPWSVRLWKTFMGMHPLVFFFTDLHPEELQLLLGLFGECRPKNYLEIGVFWGGTFEKVLQNRDRLSLTTKCFGLDIWDEVRDSENSTHYSGCPSRAAVKQGLVKRGLSNFELLAGLSSQVQNLIDQKIDFAFHDANHTYAAVKDDLEQLYPVLSDGATVLVHNASKDLPPDNDYYATDGGPYQAVMDLGKSGRWNLKQIKRRMAVLQKV